MGNIEVSVKGVGVGNIEVSVEGVGWERLKCQWRGWLATLKKR